MRMGKNTWERVIKNNQSNYPSVQVPAWILTNGNPETLLGGGWWRSTWSSTYNSTWAPLWLPTWLLAGTMSSSSSVYAKNKGDCQWMTLYMHSPPGKVLVTMANPTHNSRGKAHDVSNGQSPVFLQESSNVCQIRKSATIALSMNKSPTYMCGSWPFSQLLFAWNSSLLSDVYFSGCWCNSQDGTLIFIKGPTTGKETNSHCLVLPSPQPWPTSYLIPLNLIPGKNLYFGVFHDWCLLWVMIEKWANLGARPSGEHLATNWSKNGIRVFTQGFLQLG